MIASHANATHTSSQKRSGSLLDAEKRVLDGKRIHREISKVRDAKLGEGIHMEYRVPRPDDRGLHADMTRPEARTGAIGCAAVKRNTDESDLKLLGLGDMRQTHKCWNAREAGVAKRIKRLRMGQPKAAAGLRQDFRHGEAS